MVLRDTLRAKVHEAWDTDEGAAMRDSIRDAAKVVGGKRIGPYAVCAYAKGTSESFAECLEKVAADKGLASAYETVWGTR
jgi:hypothetical protein